TAQVVTDEAVAAGTDIEVPWTLFYSQTTLSNVDQTLVDEAARRVLTQKFRFNSAMADDPWSLKPPVSKLAANGSIETNVAHEDLAEEAVLKSAVLIANGVDGEAPVLPLPAEVTNIAVVGIK